VPWSRLTLLAVNWALVILTSAGSGAIGAAVTTYGTQAKERRSARGEVRACLRRVEQIARRFDTSHGYHAQLVAAFDDLEAALALDFQALITAENSGSFPPSAPLRALAYSAQIRSIGTTLLHGLACRATHGG
jgi:hypothetical protein